MQISHHSDEGAKFLIIEHVEFSELLALTLLLFDHLLGLLAAKCLAQKLIILPVKVLSVLEDELRMSVFLLSLHFSQSGVVVVEQPLFFHLALHISVD